MSSSTVRSRSRGAYGEAPCRRAGRMYREGIAMRSVEEYPMVIRCDGLRVRPSRVLSMANGLWRVDWTGGLVSLYGADPTSHLKLGYEPKHLRSWRPLADHDEQKPPRPIVGLGR